MEWKNSHQLLCWGFWPVDYCRLECSIFKFGLPVERSREVTYKELIMISEGLLFFSRSDWKVGIKHQVEQDMLNRVSWSRKQLYRGHYKIDWFFCLHSLLKILTAASLKSPRRGSLVSLSVPKFWNSQHHTVVSLLPVTNTTSQSFSEHFKC